MVILFVEDDENSKFIIPARWQYVSVRRTVAANAKVNLHKQYNKYQNRKCNLFTIQNGGKYKKECHPFPEINAIQVNTAWITVTGMAAISSPTISLRQVNCVTFK